MDELPGIFDGPGQPIEAALVASIRFSIQTVGPIYISGRIFSEPTPRLSHFDQKRLVLGIRRRARLLKTPHRISLVVSCSAHISSQLGQYHTAYAITETAPLLLGMQQERRRIHGRRLAAQGSLRLYCREPFAFTTRSTAARHSGY